MFQGMSPKQRHGLVPMHSPDSLIVSVLHIRARSPPPVVHNCAGYRKIDSAGVPFWFVSRRPLPTRLRPDLTKQPPAMYWRRPGFFKRAMMEKRQVSTRRRINRRSRGDERYLERTSTLHFTHTLGDRPRRAHCLQGRRIPGGTSAAPSCVSSGCN